MATNKTVKKHRGTLALLLGVLLMEEKSWAALGALAAKGICFLAGCVVMIGKHN